MVSQQRMQTMFFLIKRFATPLLSLLLAGWGSCYAAESSPVALHGRLKVKGNRIVDQSGNDVQLRGMSLFWSQWMGHYYNSNVVDWLQRDWNCSVVRAAMGIESGGYLANPGSEIQKTRRIIDAAIASGIYVVVDWHDHNAHRHLKEAKEFFQTIAREYGHRPNLIYEPWNEPLKEHGWGNVVKPYHEEIIAVIRAIDRENLIVCGTPTWSQDVDVAARDPLGANNVAYSLHFYAATHKQKLRDKAAVAMGLGAALMVTEWGTCESSGGGVLDEVETRKWWNFMEENHLSWCNWSLADKRETASALLPGASPAGGWTVENLAPSGRLVRSQLRSFLQSDAGR